MHLLTVFAFCFAVSLDGLGVGLAYGFKKASLPWDSLAAVGFTSAVCVAVAMVCGEAAGHVINPALGIKVGAVLMMVVGLSILRQDSPITNELGQREVSGSLPPQLRRLAGLDRLEGGPVPARLGRIMSGFLLGLALSMDALAAGFGAGLSGFHLLLTPLVTGLMQICTLKGGQQIGERISIGLDSKFAAQAPGLMLVLVGLIRLGR